MFEMSGATPRERQEAIRARLVEQNLHLGWNALFLIVSAGLAEGAWAPVANGMIEFAKQTNIGPLDFLKVDPVEPANANQRRGRVCRVADSLISHLDSP